MVFVYVFVVSSVITDSIEAVAVDNVHCFLYWSDTGHHKIRRSSLNSVRDRDIVDIVNNGKWICLSETVNKL